MILNILQYEPSHNGHLDLFRYACRKCERSYKIFFVAHVSPHGTFSGKSPHGSSQAEREETTEVPSFKK